MSSLNREVAKLSTGEARGVPGIRYGGGVGHQAELLEDVFVLWRSEGAPAPPERWSSCTKVQCTGALYDMWSKFECPDFH